MFGFLSTCIKKLMGGSRNERIVRSRMAFVAEQVNPLEPMMRELSDGDMSLYARQLAERLANGEARQQVVPEAFALVREATRRALGIRLYDVQLAAGMVLDSGWIAEEATGEGKTFACYPAILMAILEGKHVHVVTVNDYLVERDAGFAKQVFETLGFTVGFIANAMPTPDRQAAYASNVTYGTNSEFGFDYLRDNMKLSARAQVQSSLDFAIVDEIDSILIDEARTPLIISGPAHGDVNRYRKVDAVTRELIQAQQPWDRANGKVESLEREIRALEGEIGKNKSDEALASQLETKRSEYAQAERDRAGCTQYYEVELDKKSVQLTHEGIGLAQDVAGIGSFYVGANVEWPHMLDQSLRAHIAYEKVRRVAPGGRSEGTRHHQGRNADPRDDHAPELLPTLRQACGNDRYRDDRSRRVHEDLQARHRRGDDAPTDQPAGLWGPDLLRCPQQVRCDRRGDQHRLQGGSPGAGGDHEPACQVHLEL